MWTYLLQTQLDTGRCFHRYGCPASARPQPKQSQNDQPGNVRGQPQLKDIEFFLNPVEELGAYQFQGLDNLKRVDLDHCKISQVDPLTFYRLGKLSTINLNNNNLQFINQEVFVTLGDLKHLQTHENPWQCNCQLKSLRDWLQQQEVRSKAGENSFT